MYFASRPVNRCVHIAHGGSGVHGVRRDVEKLGGANCRFIGKFVMDWLT